MMVDHAADIQTRSRCVGPFSVRFLHGSASGN